MSDGIAEGYLRKRNRRHRWCSGRPTESHVRPLQGRGDIWICPECKEVWIGVYRLSMLDEWFFPHWSVKWKRMCSLRARRWRDRDNGGAPAGFG
ncbi:hypothetical protein FHT44_005186 [Mycolicibacterium sp. BK634]|nr:hypothetical protein [Mycolicibacterium sp. BK634]